MALVKWIPYKDLLFLQERLGRIFDEALAKYGAGEGAEGAWSPPADVYETEDSIIMKVELPGVEIEDVDLEINENVLSLRGERVLGKDVANEHYHRMECSYGTFHRVFNLPTAVDKSGVRASLNDGILQITVPKAKRPESRQIRVEVE